MASFRNKASIKGSKWPVSATWLLTNVQNGQFQEMTSNKGSKSPLSGHAFY